MSNSEDNIRNTKILQILVAVILITAIGTFGYYFIEENWTLFESFYMTVITISTVGFGETKDLSTNGRIFTVILICTGIGIVALSAGQIASFIINKEIRDILGREKINKQIKKLKNHLIICGFNNISKGLCTSLKSRGIPFVLIADNTDESDLNIEEDFLTISGDPTDDNFLIKCGIKNARGLIVAKSSDVNNLYTSLAAKELNPQIKVASVCCDPKIESRMVRAGVDFVVYPLKLGGEQVAREILKHLGKKIEKFDNTNTSVLGFSLEYFCYFEDECTTVKKILEQTGAIKAISLQLSGNETINTPPFESVVSKNDSLILAFNRNEVKSLQNYESVSLRWDSSMSVGIISLDKDHQHLVELINKIDKAIVNRASSKIINQVFDEIFEYVLTHFKHEEKLFAQYNYPQLEEHTNIHKEILERVKNLDSKRSFIRPENLISFLKEWIRQHIMVEDKKYTDYLVNKGAK